MKKSILILLSLVMVLSLFAGCNKDTAEESASTEMEAVMEEPGSQEMAVVGSIAGCAVEIVGAEMYEDTDGSDIIRVYYDFRNGTSETTFAGSLTRYAEQAGEAKPEVYSAFSDDVPEYGHEWLDIRPGVTIRCVAEFECDPEAGEVEFSLSKGEESVSTTFDPTDLSGRPEELERTNILNPQWLDGVPVEGTVDEFGSTLRINHYEVADAYSDGGEVIRVFVDYTNNTENSTSFYSANYFRVMQDGIQMEASFAKGADADTEEALYAEVLPGETISVVLTYALESESPVEVEFYDGWTHKTLVGEVFPVI